MAVVGRRLVNVLKSKGLPNISICQSLSMGTNKNDSNVNIVDENSIRKSVFISQSNDIFTNLALEDWFYRNYSFANHHVLLLWRNNPCVVIGRHQNPWLESNYQALDDDGIALARRNSGGGTVYHDSGNLNMTFFTPRQQYNRRYNLEIISRALYREWGLKTYINKREDIVVNGDYKISGTAAKLGRPNAYHHCTLLVDVNKKKLSLALERKEQGIVTNATESTCSPVRNVTDLNSHIQVGNLVNAIGWEYLRTKALTLEDGGNYLVQQQKGFQMINPTEDWFPGLNQLRSEFKSWQWNYGKSPKFTINRLLKVPVITKKTTTTDPIANEHYHLLNLTIQVKNGIVEDIKLGLPSDLVQETTNPEASVISNFRGTKYNHKVTDKIISALGCTCVPVDVTQNIKTNNIAATQ
ncbi:lipoyltransferase 1, mitochondrial [Chelonus insularis]|uniref:lipoyltransferase 1, mitochondrial n=1 Tax=Chelonus insularis TaxID=460826 RepID=UPI001588AF1A|nr:lipoyltransferase 1, mitochondrial [Chelonus insularis]